MILDIINKKRLGKELTYQELDTIFNGYLEGEVLDYQMSSLLMAICINEMSDEEIFALTKIFIDSGDVLDFSMIDGVKVDKHSTGGIGDKTTLVIAPIVASLGIPVIKMSGRGLGYTGGTIDKLESIPGYRINLKEGEILKQLQDIKIAITGQTASLVPMDKAIYALRDVTATVSSIPLIASSIMSKKIAGGADKILIDIKVGRGALLQTKQEAKELSDLMIRIGKFYQREVRTVISDMDVPLGRAIGNSLEVQEAIDVLKGEETDNEFVRLCFDLASEMVSMGKNISKEEAYEQVVECVKNGSAYQKFLDLVAHQKGDLTKMKISSKTKTIEAKSSGIIKKIDALEVGKLALSLGTGKETLDDTIDHSVGIYLNKLVGDKVKKGDVLATIYIGKKNPPISYDSIFTIDV
ncbi:MAG: thymidine phosphorylase [Bacilli bacterium]|nr:thymidine phosphorylase [Bacilli bacterium]